MTPAKFEFAICKIFSCMGYWALNIPKNHSGAQPFDVVAIKQSKVYAVDCKVCSRPRLALERIEDNQWLSFAQMEKKTNAILGFMCYYAGRIYFISYAEAKAARNTTAASISLSDDNIWRWKDEEDMLEV